MKPFGHSLSCFYKLLRCVALAVLAGYYVFGQDARAATLTVANVIAAPSAKDVRVAVNLAPDCEDAVSGVQFDLVYDASNVTLNEVQTGQAAAAAGKTASFHVATAGKATIVVSGMNKNTIATGSVAEVLFDLSDQPARQVYSLVLERIIMTDAAGRAIPALGVSGSIIVTGGEGEGEGEGESGSLSVIIEPEDALGLGAQWRVDVGPWQDSGVTLSGLAVGGHVVEFKAIPPQEPSDCMGPQKRSWIAPVNQTVAIANGQTSTISGTYVLCEKAAASGMPGTGSKGDLLLIASAAGGLLIARRRRIHVEPGSRPPGKTH